MTKFKILITTILITIMTPGCAVQNQSAQKNRIAGHWILMATLSDPGDGSGRWIPAGKEQLQEVTFEKTGAISGNLLSGASHYEVTDSNHLAISIKGNTSPVAYRYRISADALELNPPCREACGMRLVKKK